VPPERRERKGVYRSMVFGKGDKTVKIILLDTRTFRDYHIIPSIGATCATIPILGRLTPMLASVVRWFTTTFGITAYHQGDVLGEDQWKWLDMELQSDQAFTIIVSSIQVLTSAPVFESWGHFPAAKERFMKLLRNRAPRGLVLLSGDVHFAELLTSARDHTGTPSCDDIVEVTASGMTHSCLSSTKTKLFCNPVLYFYDKHRLQHDSFYLGRNFGSIDIDWSIPKLTARIHDAGSGQQLMSVDRLSCRLGIRSDTDDVNTVANPPAQPDAEL
jgi:phosphodiesterase/alkaline phosphatase D-like protein